MPERTHEIVTREALEGVITIHLDHLRVRNLRYWTIYNRGRALARLTRWASGPILYLQEGDLRRWQAERSTQIQPEPARTELSHLRGFYRWAQREGYRADDPTVRLILPRVSRAVPRPIHDTDLLFAITACVDRHTKAILGLAAFGGLRACEVSGLDWRDIDMLGENPTIRIEDGKGGHQRVIPLSATLIDLLRALPDRKGPVIKRLDGGANSVPAHRISMRANVYLHDMGITATLHQCRHRFATAAYQACQDIRAVQDLMGHKSPTTTAIYALASSEVSRSAVEAAGEIRSRS